MSSYQKDRDETIALLSAEGMPVAVIRRLFSLSQTLHRLAVASCNGDYPADNGERTVIFCPECQGGYVPSSYKRLPGADKAASKVCPDCYATAQVKALIDALNATRGEDQAVFKAIMQGDPRGCVLKTAVPSGRTNDWGREGICIPVRVR